MTEASIADPTPTKDADNVLDDYAAGFRPATKRVKVRPNLHLMARLEEIVERAEDADDYEIDALEAEYDEVRAQFEAEQVIVLRAISGDVVREVRRDARKDGIDPHALAQRAEALSKAKRPDTAALEDLQGELEHVARTLNARIIEAMAEDEDVTADWIEALYQSAPHEYAVLDRAATELLKNPGRVAPDFSRARFGTRRAG